MRQFTAFPARFIQDRAVVFGLLCAILPLNLAGQPAGTIQGTATDAATHHPVAAATITALRGGLPPFSQTVTTGPDGAFEFRALPAGTYTLCAQTISGAYLNPCEHSAVPPQVKLTEGQVSSGNAVRLMSGSVLRIRIEDPQQIVARAPGQPGCKPVARPEPGCLEPGNSGKPVLSRAHDGA